MNKIYVLNIKKFNDPDIYMEARRHISEERIKKADSMARMQGKFRSVGAGYLISIGLEDAGLSPFDERIAYSTYGKPYLPDHPDVHFNVSHSGNYVVCAFADKTVGIDIEEIHDIKPSLVKYALNKQEFTMYDNLPESERLNFFFENWTGKEAFLKHIAKGLSVRPSEIYAKYEEKINALNFYNWHDIPGYVITLCSAMEKPDLTEVEL
ncbi:MAG: 4'-phosphopantetheinyl transferase superfamily protein [Lachnospiraceae bacterium]|nr:4'-phosphopantetheinyl transferase superfamily protein [Lachnospiraceae bacterium]